MDVNNLFALLLVNAMLGLSTPFLLDSFSSPLHCFGHTCYHHSSSGQGGKKRDLVLPYCEIETINGRLQGHCGENGHHINMCPQYGNSKCRCYDQLCINGVSERFAQQQKLYRMTYACLQKTCHGTESCHMRGNDNEIVSSCSNHVPHSNEYCTNHDSVISLNGCYCNTADCVQNTALHCFGVTCKLTQGCEIYRHNGQFAARCYSLNQCDDNCIDRCHVPLILDHAHLPCHCESQVCADNIVIPTVTTHMPTTAVPALQQLDPYTCVAENCDKHEPFCHLYEANNNVKGRCMIFQGGQCSSSNDLSVNGGCYCFDSKCVFKAITDYNQKHTTAPTLSQGFMCSKKLCRSDMYCHIVNYQGVATSRCLVIPVAKTCQSYKDVGGNGCMCNNAHCSINILTEFSLHHPASTATTTTATTARTTTTTPTTTPTTTTPITTITTPATTTPTITTTTTTTPRTTSISSTTTDGTHSVAYGPRTCHICGDTIYQVPCSSRQIERDLPQTCKTGENYCMTDIVQDAQGNVDVFKRCVDLAICENKWITESAGLDYCKRYGVVTNPNAFSCHFCCTQDKCNSMIVPNATTWYTKTN